MCHLFAGISPVSIGVTPFMPQEFFGKEYTGEQLGLTDCRSVYIAPAVAGFVGGDITSDLLAVMQKNPKEKVLLLDIGTNGEMAVGNEDQIYCCATAVGSAFEGAEMAMGMPAAVGAISHVWLDQRRIRVQVIGDEEACGICGSGLIDALAVILEMGLLDHTGLLKQKQSVSVAYRKYLGEYAGQPCVWLAHKVCVTQEDIRGLQLAKAAFAAGMRILLQDSHTSYEQLDHVILAGGFGSYLKKRIGSGDWTDSKGITSDYGVGWKRGRRRRSISSYFKKSKRAAFHNSEKYALYRTVYPSGFFTGIYEPDGF